jgi:excinuclease UvrABC nuclease subunit
MSNEASWSGYSFGVYEQNADWNDVGGVYIFCGVNSRNEWVAIYVGETGSFRKRIPSHEQWSPAQHHGAIRVHARVEKQEATRLAIEELLIRAYQPILNVQLKQSASRSA